MAGEMKPGWPLEAYAAQAIVARTFTMEFHQPRRNPETPRHRCVPDETHTQAYNPSNINETIKKAVDSTRGQVLTYNGEYIKAWFNAACGGITARAKEGLAYPDAEPPYTVNKKCPEAKYSPSEVKSWSATFTYKELAELLKELEIKSVEKLEIAKKSDAGRVESWKIVHSGGSTEVSGAGSAPLFGSHAPALQRDYGASQRRRSEKQLPSGAGVWPRRGLCQWGAYTLAKGKEKRPLKLPNIISRGTKIEKRWR